MDKVNRKEPKNKASFRESPAFYEELTILKGQDLIAELMAASETSKTELAARLGQTKAHVTELLSEDRNLTLRTFGRVCFHLGAEVIFDAQPVDHAQWVPVGYQASFSKTAPETNEHWITSRPVSPEEIGPWNEVRRQEDEDQPVVENSDDLAA